MNRGAAFMLALFLYNILLMLVLPLVLALFNADPTAGFFRSPWFIILSQVLSFLVPLAAWLAFTRDRLADHIPRMKLGKVNSILIPVLCFFLLPSMMLISGLTSLVFPNPVAETMAALRDYSFPAMAAAVALTPAFCEEVVFRGYILSQYRHAGIKKAAWVSGLFFGIMHMDAQQFLYAFLLGVVFAYLVHYTRSIRAGMLAHFFINFMQLALERLSQAFSTEAAAAESVTNAELLQGLAAIAVIALIFMAGAVPVFLGFRSYNRKRNLRYDLATPLISDV